MGQRFLSAQADPFTGVKGEELRSACSVRNDGRGDERRDGETSSPLQSAGQEGWRGKLARYKGVGYGSAYGFGAPGTEEQAWPGLAKGVLLGTEVPLGG
jgi:hypothetical protein